MEMKQRTPDFKKKLSNHISRLIGQLNGIDNMIKENRYCDDILIQLSAVDKSIKSLANTILDDHIHSCVIDKIKSGNDEVADELVDLFKRFQ